MKKMWQEFVKFIMTGNLITLAVAFVLGGATKAVIDSFVNDIVNPIIGAIVGKPKFDNVIGLGDGKILIGSFITAVVNLVIIGFVLFMIVKAYDGYQARKKAAGEEPEAPDENILLLREIRDSLAARS